jgi:phosphodiesterase/alkaline phosphatase D-like protein
MGTPATVQVNITGLSPGTTYYYRAKAVGSSTVYGAVMSFTTRAV